VIAAADWVIDLGPGGGREGGRLVAEGPPGEVAKVVGSPTGRALARRFARHLSDKKPA
jgi:excinuclease ABC subunit A